MAAASVVENKHTTDSLCNIDLFCEEREHAGSVCSVKCDILKGWKYVWYIQLSLSEYSCSVYMYMHIFFTIQIIRKLQHG